MSSWRLFWQEFSSTIRWTNVKRHRANRFFHGPKGPFFHHLSALKREEKGNNLT
jgi:hypothetical protein